MLRWSLILIILFSGYLLIQILTPRKYNVPDLPANSNTHFWQLSTGSKLSYTFLPAKGERNTNPIIYLHGGPGAPISNRIIQTLSFLADLGYDVYFYDQAGSGYSSRFSDIKDYTALRHKKDLEEITNKIGVNKVILMGQSWGAILALLYIADNPGKVEKLILTGPGPIYPLLKKMNEKAPDSLQLQSPVYSNAQGYNRASNMRSRYMNWMAVHFNIKVADDKEADNFATLLNYEVNKSCVCDTAKILPPEGDYGYYAQLMTFKSLRTVPDPRPKIRQSLIPLLVLKGQCDNQSWNTTKEYLDLFPNSRLKIIPNAGHFIEVEQPAAYIQSIKEFLTEAESKKNRWH